MAGMGDLQNASNRFAEENDLDVKITYDHVRCVLGGLEKLILYCAEHGKEKIDFQKLFTIEFKKNKARDFRNPQNPEGPKIHKPEHYTARVNFKRKFNDKVNNAVKAGENK